MSGGRQEERKWDDRPHDWDREGRGGGRERGRRCCGDEHPRGPERDPKDIPYEEQRPGPDGVPRPPYHGPRTTEEYLVREWQEAYAQASHELRVSAIKEQIRKTWGKSLEDIAVELDNLMCKEWEISRQDGDHDQERAELLKKFSKLVLDAYNKGP